MRRFHLIFTLVALGITVSVFAGGCGKGNVSKERAKSIVQAGLDNRFNMLHMNLLEVRPEQIQLFDLSVEVWKVVSVKAWKVVMECDCHEAFTLTAYVDRRSGAILNWFTSTRAGE